MNWRLVGRTIRLVFLLRVPLLTLVLLAALGPYARGSDLLDNLFDLGNHPGDLFLVSFNAFLLACTAITAINLTLHYGSERLDDQHTFPMSPRRPLLTFILGSCAAVTFVVSAILRTEELALGWKIAASTGGMLAAFALVIIAKVVQLALTDPKTTRYPPPYLIFPAARVPWAKKRLDRVYCWRGKHLTQLKTGVNCLLQWPLRILQGAGQGYLVDPDPPAGVPLMLRSGHVFALSLATMALGVYVATDWSFRLATDLAPALVFVLLFLIVGCWYLSALTFFFDRYRLPLLSAVAGIALITAQTPQADRFFRVERRDIRTESYLSPAQFVAGRAAKADHRRLILVATPGGGIQAAAWTGQVLGKLGTDSQVLTNGNTLGNAFQKAVTLISSVSGGSLGSMVVAAAYAGQIQWGEVPAKARESAINEVAWGWLNPDFWSTIVPWFRDRTIDRGWALEEKWAEVNNLGEGTLLSDWAARGDALPALVFNSMLVEPGRHVIFTTSRFPKAAYPDGDSRGIQNFYDLYPRDQYDIRVNTAARLSASFPYVAPAARSNVESPFIGDYHFVDGGYYDNYGIDSLIGWLYEALFQKDSPAIEDILVLNIRHFNPDAERTAAVHGWGFQLFAPVSGLLAMWNNSPVHRDANEFRLLADYLRGNKVQRIWSVTLPYRGTRDCAKAPLSWKLTQSQQQCIDDSWNQLVASRSPDLACIRWYLDGKTDANQSPGENPARCYDPSRSGQ